MFYGGEKMSIVRISDLIENFSLTLIAGKDGVHRQITTGDISRPGIEMTGYFKYYPKERLQLIGTTEMAYFLELSDEDQNERARRLCTDVTPGILISREMDVPDVLIKAADHSGVPILRSPLTTTAIISRLTIYLEAKFAPFTAIHGVLVDIYGVGVLIRGQSGIGKSETALELVKRGHRLVADDSVEIRREDYDKLIGTSPPLIKHMLEIRGLGIIDVMSLFGAGSIINYKKISLIITLELWDQKTQYDRIGADEETMKIMDVHIPQLTIPIRPGRNLAVIIEVAAMNFRLKRMGINAAEEFTDRLADMISNEQDQLESE